MTTFLAKPARTVKDIEDLVGLCSTVPALQSPTKSSMPLTVLAGFHRFEPESDISDVAVTN